MKRIVVTIVALAIALAGTQVIVRADDTSQAPMTDAMITHIRTVCSSVQANLNRLHASDALLRVNQGQTLLAISDRLMTPLNSRIAINQLDGGKMTSITSTYVTQFSAFDSDYKQYEQAMARAMQIDCTKQPAAFYSAVADARTKRATVHDRMTALRKSLTDYRAEVDVLAAKVGGSAQ